MNNHIKELAAQAVEETQLMMIMEYKSFESKLYEKFAELIVRECYDTIKKDMELAHIQLIPIDFGIYANGRLRRIMKDHFGVEE